MEEIIEEVQPQPKYALLSPSDYFRLNHDISIARGWQLGGDTERTFPMNPQACRTAIQLDAEGNELSYTAKLVMPLSGELQTAHADLLLGVELFDDYTPVDHPIQELILGVMSLELINWAFVHFMVSGGSEAGLKLVVTPEFISMLPQEMLQGISQLGLDIEIRV